MNWTLIIGLLVILLFALLIVGIWIATRDHPYKGLRSIPAFERLQRAIHLSVEEGSRVNVSLGSSELLSPTNASAFVGLAMLKRIGRVSAACDTPPVATSGNSNLAILSQDTLHTAYRVGNKLPEFDPTLGRITGFTPFSYAAGVMPVMRDEQISANVLVGDFGAESALLAEAGNRSEAFVLGGSNALNAQAIYFAAALEPLIGEEVFAGGAYLQAGPTHAASLHAEDVARWVLIAVMLGGSILKLAGIL